MGVQMNFKQEYQSFMREFVDTKWLQYYPNVKVLAENFVNGKYYVLIFEADNTDGKKAVYILIENQKKVEAPLFIHSYINTKGYHISSKFELIGKIPEKIYTKLIQNGLFEDINKSQGGKKAKGTFGIHRLVLSLYDKCLGYKVHHINKKRDFCPICNLVKMEKYFHKNLHEKIYTKSFTAGVIKSLKEQNKLKKKLRKPKKFSHKDAPENIIKVLNWRIAK